MSPCALATWAFRSATSACSGLRSVQAAKPTANATAAAAFTTLAHFIFVPFGLLIRDVLITDPSPVGKFRRIRRAQLHQICLRNATPNTPSAPICLLRATSGAVHLKPCQVSCVAVSEAFGAGICRRHAPRDAVAERADCMW